MWLCAFVDGSTWVRICPTASVVYADEFVEHVVDNKFLSNYPHLEIFYSLTEVASISFTSLVA